MLTLFLARSLVGKITGGRCSDIWSPRRTIGGGFLITSFSVILIPLTTGFSLILVLLLAGIALYMIQPALLVLTSEIKTTNLGLAYGIQVLSGAVFTGLSRLLSGIISDAVGIQYVFLLLSAVALCATIFVYLFLREA